MAEGRSPVDGTTRVLPQPFLVIATMNPLEHDGTFPLPAAQLDRFTIRISMGFPPPDAEMRMLDVHIGKGVAVAGLSPVLAADEFLGLQGLVQSIYVAGEREALCDQRRHGDAAQLVRAASRRRARARR